MYSRIDINHPYPETNPYGLVEQPEETPLVGIRQARRTRTNPQPMPGRQPGTRYLDHLAVLNQRLVLNHPAVAPGTNDLLPVFDFEIPPSSPTDVRFCAAPGSEDKPLKDYTPDTNKINDLLKYWQGGNGGFKSDAEFPRIPTPESYQDIKITKGLALIQAAKAKDGTPPGKIGPEELKVRMMVLDSVNTDYRKLGKLQLELVKELNYVRAAYMSELQAALKANSPLVGPLGDTQNPPDPNQDAGAFVKQVKDNKKFWFLFNSAVKSDDFGQYLEEAVKDTSAGRFKESLEGLSRKYKPIIDKYERLVSKLEALQSKVVNNDLLTVDDGKGNKLPFQIVTLSPHEEDKRLVTYKKEGDKYVPDSVLLDDGTLAPVATLGKDKEAWKTALAKSPYAPLPNQFAGYGRRFTQLLGVNDALTEYADKMMALYRANLIHIRYGTDISTTGAAHKKAIMDSTKNLPLVADLGNALADGFGLIDGWGPLGYQNDIDKAVAKFKGMQDSNALELYQNRVNFNTKAALMFKKFDEKIQLMLDKSLENIREFENPKGEFPQ